MDLITGWVKEVFIIILSITFIEILIPESNMAKYLKFIFSIIILATILGPISYFCNK